MDTTNKPVLTPTCATSNIHNEGIDLLDASPEAKSYRKASEIKIQLPYEFLASSNRRKDIRPLLADFICAVKHQTNCELVAVHILDEGGNVSYLVTEGICMNTGNVEKILGVEIDSYIFQQVACNTTDATQPCFTEHGSYFPSCGSLTYGEDKQSKIRQSGGSCTSGHNNLALIPIRLTDQTLGMLYIGGWSADKRSIEDVKMVEAASVQLAIAIQRILAEEALKTSYLHLEERIRERTQELSRANEDLRMQVKERRLAEERLKSSHEMLQTVIDGLTDSLILVDQHMHVRMLNRVAAKYYGLNCSESVSGLMCSAASGLEGACDVCKIPDLVMKGETTTFERRSPIDPDRIEEVSIYSVQGKNEHRSDAIIKITDITENKKLERQLIQSEKMASLGVLVASIAHEINNPNNFIFFNIPIMREYLLALIRIADEYAERHAHFELFNMPYDDFRRDAFKLVDNIEHGSKRISSFVDNLREFSLEKGERSKEWLDLQSVVDKVVTLCSSQIKKRVKKFEVNIPEDLPPIYADVYSVEQILLNLIINAVQAANKKDSCITVTATGGKSWQNHTTITVSDNGCGMDEKTIQKIFDPFFTTKKAADGTGLGLYVSHNLIESLGGRIEVESEVGGGSKFKVILPDKDRRRVPRG